MGTLLRDARYAVRVLRKRPAFTILAVLCLALGIGANAAIFSVVDSVLLQALPFPASNRLLSLTNDEANSAGYFPFSAPDFVDYRAQAKSAELAAYTQTSFNFRSTDVPQRLQAASVSSNFFHVLGVSPQFGRGFDRDEELPKRGNVVVLGHDLWQRAFGGDRSIVGKTVRLDGADYTVIGIMPDGFTFPIQTNRIELWVPETLAGDSTFEDGRGAHYLRVIARLAPGATMSRAERDLQAIAARLAERYPAKDHGRTVSARLLQDSMVGDSRRALLVLSGAVCFVLLIACANVANLMLARATMRTKEMAVRVAMGASRRQIVRQLMTEGVILAVAGGALGLLFATWGTNLLLAAAPGALPRVNEIALDWRALAFTFGVSVITGLLFGLAPALQATRGDLHSTLKEGGRSVTGAGSAHRLRSGLVVGEIALSLVLLAGAGLLGASLLRLQETDRGFETQHLITAQIDLSGTKYPTDGQINRFFVQLVERVRALPGVTDAAAVSTLPFSGRGAGTRLALEGEARPATGGFPHSVDFDVITPDYFRTARIPLKAGRTLTAQDDSAAPRVVVVNEAFAKRYWPNQNVLGKRISLGFINDSLWEIVGLVGNVRRMKLTEPAAPEVYIPLAKGTIGGSMYFMVRTSRPTSEITAGLRREVLALDPDQALSKVRPMEDVVSDSLARNRFSTFLVGIFAVVALALSAIGIYGVMMSLVSQRTREIAVRMALGARQHDVLGMVLRQGTRLAVLGVVIGLVGAFALTRVLTSMLYEVNASDPLMLIAVSVLLTAVALIASYVPARRATRVDPMIALQSE